MAGLGAGFLIGLALGTRLVLAVGGRFGLTLLAGLGAGFLVGLALGTRFVLAVGFPVFATLASWHVTLVLIRHPGLQALRRSAVFVRATGLAGDHRRAANFFAQDVGLVIGAVFHPFTFGFKFCTFLAEFPDFLSLGNEAFPLLRVHLLETRPPFAASTDHAVETIGYPEIPAVTILLRAGAQCRPSARRTGVHMVATIFIVVLALAAPVAVIAVFPTIVRVDRIVTPVARVVGIRGIKTTVAIAGFVIVTKIIVSVTRTQE